MVRLKKSKVLLILVVQIWICSSVIVYPRIVAIKENGRQFYQESTERQKRSSYARESEKGEVELRVNEQFSLHLIKNHNLVTDDTIVEWHHPDGRKSVSRLNETSNSNDRPELQNEVNRKIDN